jgi:hypothetical protein
VLKKVSMAAGYEISLDNKWQSYRVTVSLEEVSLHKGLKQILRNLNNAIIYDSNKKNPPGKARSRTIKPSKHPVGKLKNQMVLKVLTILR